MPYHLYKTEAFVLDERPFGEANKVFSLLTPDLGLVTAMAQGIRALGSKLRYHIGKYALSSVVLVRGKETWRLVGAEEEHSFENIFASKKKFSLLAKVFSLLHKFIRGEGEQAALYDDLKRALEYLNDFAPIEGNESMLKSWELVTVLRLLHHLGYIEDSPAILPFIQFRDWELEILSRAIAERLPLTETINKAIKASHIS